MRKLLPISALALAAGAAQADTTGLYVGAGITKAKVDNIFSRDLNIDSTAWKAIVGFRPISLFAVEANYLDLGSETRSFAALGTAHADAKAFAAYGVGFLPIPLPMVDVYGKLGLARWKLSGNAGPTSSLFRISDDGTEFAWGVGAQAHFGNIAGRLEYEHFNLPNTDGAKVYTLGVTLNIL
jgi:outer membrane immunogenic protein